MTQTKFDTSPIPQPSLLYPPQASTALNSSSILELIIALVTLLVLSAFFSLSETAVMASNRHRLRHLAKQGHRGAQQILALLTSGNQLVSVILLGNSLAYTGIAILTGIIVFEFLDATPWVILGTILTITLILLIFSEIIPRIIGTAYADPITRNLGFILPPLVKVASPLTWIPEKAVKLFLKTIQLPATPTTPSKLTQGELRTLILESREIIPPTHGTILTNLIDLGMNSVEDVMLPRREIEFIDLESPREDILNRIMNCQHKRIPVCRESLDQVLGTLAPHRLAYLLQEPDFEPKDLLEYLTAPYYIPAGTSLLTQLGFFQESSQYLGFVVDEYGEILGLVTLEDIMQQILGEFRSSLPGPTKDLNWDTNGTTLLEGKYSLREINQKLGLHFPLDGPKTLNGLILEYFEDIPESGTSLKLHGIPVEIIKTQDKSVKTVKITRPQQNTVTDIATRP